MRYQGSIENEGLWHPENSNTWAIYRSWVNREYRDANGDCLGFKTKKEAQAFCDKLNKQELP